VGVVNVGTTFVVVSLLKVGAFFSVGTVIYTGVNYFLNFKIKPKSKKEKGDESDGKREALLQKSGLLD
jgi:hypothetical protein